MDKKRVLIIDDEVEVTSFLKYLLADKNCDIEIANRGSDVDPLLSLATPFDLALVDLKLPDANGLDLLTKIKKSHPSCEVVMMTGYGTVQSAVYAIQSGARDYLEKPFENIEQLEELFQSIFTQTRVYDNELVSLASHYGITFSPISPFRNVLSIASKLAKKPINILIEGETGTGKELLARFIHGSSLRSTYSFVGVNCGAISETLLESELFGHEKGAFTGAVKSHKGFFELADNGTLFLDEIGEASLSIQVKLLRVLETREFRRVGSENSLSTNVRIIAATNRNLEFEAESNHFRADLLYRLEGVKLVIPPLRERKEDIAFIAKHYLATKYGVDITDETIAILQAYDWPGNIRQLLNVLNQSVALHDCKILKMSDLPQWLFEKASSSTLASSTIDKFEIHAEREIEAFIENIMSAIETIDDIDFERLMATVKKVESNLGKKIIEKGLLETRGNRQVLSQKLNISPRTLRYILNEK